MKVLEFFLCVLVVVFVSLGQVCLKYIASRYEYEDTIFGFIFNNYYLFIAVCVLYGVAGIAWFYVLTKISLTVGFMFFLLCFFLVPFFSNMILGEVIPSKHYVSFIFIFIGIFLFVVEINL